MWNKIKISKKKFVIGVIILIIIFVVYKFIYPGKTGTSKLSTSPTPYSYRERPVGEKMTISGVSFNNIYDKEVETNPRGDTLFSQNNNYQIVYFSEEEQFLISITGSPFEKNRILAEKDFLKTLGISEEEACKLDTTISTPSFANLDESGVNYKLSFCDK